jgi:glycosyltransferase domain-containing protein
MKTLLNITFGPGNRKQTLKSIIDYYNNFPDDKLPFIVITDQSESTWKDINHRVIKAFHHYPVSKYNMYEMWIDLIEKYNPEYFCWNNDDDFTTPESIFLSEKFMDNNREYSIVQGQVVATIKNSSKIYPYAQSTWFKKDVDTDNILDRIKLTFNHLHANPHAVFKANTFKNACNLCLNSYNRKNNFGCLRFWDKILCYVAAVDGKRKTNLDCLMSIRSDRLLTSQVALISNLYHNILEKHTPYSEIHNRLKKPDNEVIKYFNNIINNIEFPYSIFNQNNIGFNSLSNNIDISKLPHQQNKWKTHLNLAVEAWGKINNKYYE